MVIEVADIFRQYGPTYRAKFGHQMSASQHQAMRAIERCRTEALGGHLFACDHCAEQLYSYHSCRNRHCPKCQNNTATQWLETQQQFMLPVPYFMVTFTLPAELRELARSRPQLIYNLLFRASAAALQQLAADPRFVGGKIGLVGVLHTWTRTLTYHPHVHYLVPAGALALDGSGWVAAKNNFLVHVRPLSRLFRAKFRAELKKSDLFKLTSAKVWQKDWVVHCKPVGDGKPALKYLATYIFRVAISHNRLLKVADGQVTFRYKDSTTGKAKYCTLSAETFIHRFLQHVLPKGFVKVRYYGLFSPGLRSLLNQTRQVFDETPSPSSADNQSSTVVLEAVPEPVGSDDVMPCPKCGQPMVVVKRIKPICRSP